MTSPDSDDGWLQTGSPFMEMDVNAEKKIWIKTVVRFLLIGQK